MSEKYKKAFTHLSYVEHLLILALIVTGCVRTSAFGSLVCIWFRSQFCCHCKNQKYQSIIKKKKKKKHDKIVFLGKDTLNTIELLNPTTLIDSYISNEKFVSLSNVLRDIMR